MRALPTLWHVGSRICNAPGVRNTRGLSPVADVASLSVSGHSVRRHTTHLSFRNSNLFGRPSSSISRFSAVLGNGNEVEVKLPGRLKVSPQMVGATKAATVVVTVEAL